MRLTAEIDAVIRCVCVCVAHTHTLGSVSRNANDALPIKTYPLITAGGAGCANTEERRGGENGGDETVGARRRSAWKAVNKEEKGGGGGLRSRVVYGPSLEGATACASTLMTVITRALIGV